MNPLNNVDTPIAVSRIGVGTCVLMAKDVAQRASLPPLVEA